MNGLGKRLLISAVPAALLLAVLGYLYAEVAGTWFESGGRGEHPGTLTASLRSRLPFTMAAWGFGLVTLYELLRSAWAPRPKPKPVETGPSVEEQLQQLLRVAEARNPATTPPPAGCRSPVAADNTAHDPA